MEKDGYKGVLQLAYERENWIPVVQAALEVAKSTNADFAGAWVLSKANEKGIKWFPNLRILVTHGILVRESVSRAGRRAYYSMPDKAGVERALRELEAVK